MKHLLCWVWLIAALPSLAGEKLTPEKLWELNRVGSPTVSPDGQHVVFTVRQYDWRENKGNTDLWLVSIEGGDARQLTTSQANDSNPIWAADGQSIFFVSKRTGRNQVFRLNLAGGEAQQITMLDQDMDTLKISPGGDFILFRRSVKLESNILEKYPDLPKADARLYDQLKFRHWDSWFEGTYNHLFRAKLDGSEAKDLMPNLKQDTPLKPFGGGEDFDISPDGKEICYTALVPGRPAGSTDTGLYLIPAEGGKAKLITPDMGGYDTHPIYSPDGKSIAFLSMATPGYESDRNRIMLYDRQRGEITELTAGRDQTVSSFIWFDDKTILFNAPFQGTVQVYRLNVENGQTETVTKGRHNLNGLASGGGNLVALKSTNERPYEVYRINPTNGDLTKLTGANDGIYAKLDLPKVEARWDRATDGKRLHSWVIYPPNFDPAKKYPMLTYCQGGPQGMVSQSFSYRWNFHLMAAQGYVVLAVNRRGLPGFGRAWNDEIRMDYGGQPLRDTLTATDAMLAQPYIDKDRVGAVGASYGGYMIFRLMGENYGDQKRFATMIAHDGFFNMESWYLTTEELFFPNRDQGGPFWTSQAQKDNYAKHSPHTYVQRWETPIMVIHGQKDFRVPATEGIQAFQAAKILGLKAQFLYFPEENHWVLSPQNGILWQRLFYDWLERTCRKKS